MDQIIYTPDEMPNENVIKAHDELLNASFGNFGWGASPTFSILGILMSILFNPSTTLYRKHPFPKVNDEEFLNEMENTSTEEEKQEVLKSHLDEYWTKMFNKMKDPSPEAAQDLLDRLSDVNSKLDELNEQKQDIIDDWIME